MPQHVFGKTINKQLARFIGNYNDEEFEETLKLCEGTLPPGWKAWHFQDNENITNSKRAQVLAKRPVITKLHWSGSYYPATKGQMMKMLKDDHIAYKRKQEEFSIHRNEMIDGIAHVEGTFEGRPFEMRYCPDESTGTIDGDFTDLERAQILTAWELEGTA